jgi:aminoglycoside N3'-acetyltransferase
MSIVTSADRIQAELAGAFEGLGGGPLILHSDLVQIGFVRKGKSIHEQLTDWVHMIREAAAGRTLLFPTFNYDYARSGIYRPRTDPGQVGALGEHARQLQPDQRTLTPIFNFVVIDGSRWPLAPVENPFSQESTFGVVRAAGGSVAFLGASFGANTFTHHVEEAVEAPYRYIKPFPGIIDMGDSPRAITLLYRVRPPNSDAVEYDWRRLSEDLRTRGILRRFPLGNAWLDFYRMEELFDYWIGCLSKEETYLLTEASKARVQELYRRFGKPLRFKTVEAGG